MAGTITRYVYDGEDILLEYDGTNIFVARYSHGDQVDQPLVLQKAGLGFFYYHSNHQGSITHLTDSSGTVANSYVYDSYGRRLNVAESVLQPYSYTGREFDVESGLYFYRARYYDANTGRFLSEDPIRLAGRDQNLYRYVFNDPLNLTDPTGLFVDRCDELRRAIEFNQSMMSNPEQCGLDQNELINETNNLIDQFNALGCNDPPPDGGTERETESNQGDEDDALPQAAREDLEQAAAAGATAAALRQLFLRFIIGVGVIIVGS